MQAKVGLMLILRRTAENLARTTMHALLKGLALNGSFGSFSAGVEGLHWVDSVEKVDSLKSPEI
jgi:hypothetical protein